MSDIIQLLPESLANQIAAGEVIQRPASVVKELLENAVDAGATQIKLIIKDAGKSLIQVVDNGHGMTEMDARMCFERHATSKISQTNDLFHIETKGFRGEALASIAAIASVELKTKHIDQELGSRLVIEGSKLKTQESCQCHTGSSFAVRRLFYNVPARRKFLKSDPVELRHILDEFQRIALPHHDIQFACYHNDQEIYRLPRCNARQRTVQILGKASNEKIIPIDSSSDFVTITGFISKPDYTKKTRSDQYLFVNKRFFKSGYYNHAILAAYDQMIPDDRYPSYVVYLTVDPAKIDVNVHPTKHEIKFEEEKLIYQYLRVSARQALAKYSITPAIDFDQDHAFVGARGSATSSSTSTHSGSTNKSSFQGIARKQETIDAWENMYAEIAASTPEPVKKNTSEITLNSAVGQMPDQAQTDGSQNAIFQLHGRYIIAQIKSGLLVLDQQASHERILYERFLGQLANSQKSVQKLLFPETVQLSAEKAECLKMVLDQLNQLGFDIEAFGHDSFIVRGIPAHEQHRINATEAIHRFLEMYTHQLDSNIGLSKKIAHSMARSCAIKSGTILQKEELQILIDQLFACEAPYQSPSGANCFVTMDTEFIQSQFDKKHS